MVGPTILNEEQKAKPITQLTTQTLLTPVLRNRIVMRAADSRAEQHQPITHKEI